MGCFKKNLKIAWLVIARKIFFMRIFICGLPKDLLSLAQKARLSFTGKFQFLRGNRDAPYKKLRCNKSINKKNIKGHY